MSKPTLKFILIVCLIALPFVLIINHLEDNPTSAKEQTISAAIHQFNPLADQISLLILTFTGFLALIFLILLPIFYRPRCQQCNFPGTNTCEWCGTHLCPECLEAHIMNNLCPFEIPEQVLREPTLDGANIIITTVKKVR